MNDLKNLICEIDAAEEGSSDLDCKIWRTLGSPLGRVIRSVRPDMHYICTEGDEVVPPYTTSLDAGLTLMPEEWSWRLHFQPWVAATKSQFSELYHVSATPWDGENLLSGRTVNGAAINPALAICIAALRARQS